MVLLHAATKFEQQTRFSHPGLTQDADNLAMALLGLG
jgi:hypothetical protein